MKSIGTSYILLWFFGIFGVHRFYMGKVGTGLLWLFTLGILGIGILYDLFTLESQVREVNAQAGFPMPPPGIKSVGTAYILLILFGLGFLGVHRFYLGKAGTGILWLFTFGLFGIGWLYDLFTLEGQVNEYNTTTVPAPTGR